jgi:acyl carrier protein
MDTSKAMDTLKAILTELGILKESLHDDARLHEDLQLDSTEIVEIALGLKRQLGVSVKLEGRQDLTLAQVSNKVEAALRANSNSNHVS